MDPQGDISSESAGNLVELAAEIVSAYVSNNSVRSSELPDLIAQIHNALKGVGTQQAEPEAEKRQPAVPIKKSVQPDYIVSLFDGKKYKSLKRHIRTAHDMTPEQYRAYWGLARDCPMVDPNYAKARSQLARSMGAPKLQQRLSWSEMPSIARALAARRTRIKSETLSRAWDQFGSPRLSLNSMPTQV